MVQKLKGGTVIGVVGAAAAGWSPFSVLMFIIGLIPTIITIFNFIIICFFLYILQLVLTGINKLLKQFEKIPGLGSIIKKEVKIPKTIGGLFEKVLTSL